MDFLHLFLECSEAEVQGRRAGAVWCQGMRGLARRIAPVTPFGESLWRLSIDPCGANLSHESHDESLQVGPAPKNNKRFFEIEDLVEIEVQSFFAFASNNISGGHPMTARTAHSKTAHSSQLSKSACQPLV